MPIIDIQQFTIELSRLSALKNLAFGSAKAKFEARKRSMLKDFDNHAVTQEIKAGANATSKFLPEGDGNLFSLMGFFDKTEDKLISDVRNVLQDEIKLRKSPGLVPSFGKRLEYKFEVDEPTQAKIEESAPPPPEWDSRPWIRVIEDGIPGFAFYVFSRKNKLPNSRSGPALQSKGEVRKRSGMSIGPIAYISEILSKFRDSLK